MREIRAAALPGLDLLGGCKKPLLLFPTENLSAQGTRFHIESP
jgi:hypothetical protein